MFSFEAKWQATEVGSGVQGLVQSLGQVGRQGHVPRLEVKLKVNLDDIPLDKACSGAIGGADPKQAPTSHQRRPAAPRMAVDDDGDRRPSVSSFRCGGAVSRSQGLRALVREASSPESNHRPESGLRPFDAIGEDRRPGARFRAPIGGVAKSQDCLHNCEQVMFKM